MTGNQQQPIDPQVKSPFSPLQTGCAFVMLTNMVIYLGVVLFTFNLLDPSKIDASYLAKRGFTTRPEPKSEQDAAFENLSQEKKEQQQLQMELIDSSKPGPQREPSPAAELSRIEDRALGSSLPEEQEKPKAARIESSRQSGRTAPRAAPSRLYSVSIYPQATVPQAYSPVQIAVPRLLEPEAYETIPVEMAPGISIPAFSLPSIDSAGPYLYRPGNPIPEALRSGLKLSVPPIGAESLYTNSTPANTPETTKPPAAKDRL